MTVDLCTGMPACGPPATPARRGAKVFGVCVRDRVSFDTSSLVDKHMICELYQDSGVSQELPDQLATNVARSWAYMCSLLLQPSRRPLLHV